MGWIVKVKTDEPPHSCALPDFMSVHRQGLGVGSIWECPKCKRRYMYKGATMGEAVYEESYPK